MNDDMSDRDLAPASLLSRRTLLSGGGLLAATLMSSAAAATQAPLPAAAQVPADPHPLVPTAQYEDAYAQVVGTATPLEADITLDLPEDAENGNIVPYKIAVESPMTPDAHITRVHLLSTQNPQAGVAVFHFTPLSGRAAVSGRMRLAKTQEVVAIAVTSANTLLIGRRTVNVGIGGCATE